MINRRDLMTGTAAVAGVAVLPPAAGAASSHFVRLQVYVRHDDPTQDDLDFLHREYDRASRPSLASKARDFIAWDSNDPTDPTSSFSWYSGQTLCVAQHFIAPCGTGHPVAKAFKPGFFDILAFTGWGSIPKKRSAFFAPQPSAILQRIGSLQDGVAQRRRGIDEGLDIIEAWFAQRYRNRRVASGGRSA
jgi:hypothetical protein